MTTDNKLETHRTKTDANIEKTSETNRTKVDANIEKTIQNLLMSLRSSIAEEYWATVQYRYVLGMLTEAQKDNFCEWFDYNHPPLNKPCKDIVEFRVKSALKGKMKDLPPKWENLFIEVERQCNKNKTSGRIKFGYIKKPMFLND